MASIAYSGSEISGSLGGVDQLSAEGIQAWLQRVEADYDEYNADDEDECFDDVDDLFTATQTTSSFPVSPTPTARLRLVNSCSPAGVRFALPRNPSSMLQFDSDDNDSDDDIEHECPPNCLVCRVSASIFRIRHPELFDFDDDKYEDDFADIATSAPPTHCLPNCITCAREQLRAEGWKFPVYDHCDDDENRSETTDRGDGLNGEMGGLKTSEKLLASKDPQDDRKLALQLDSGLCEDLSGIFSPPPPDWKFKSTQAVPTHNQHDEISYPRVFFPPSKDVQVTSI